MDIKIKEALSKIKSTLWGDTCISLQWYDVYTETNSNEGDFLMDINSVVGSGNGDWVFTYDPTVTIEQETVVDTTNDEVVDIRAQVYTDKLFNVNKIILIMD